MLQVRLACLLAPLALLPSCALAVGAAIGAGVVHTTSEDTAEMILRDGEAAVFAAAEATLESLGRVEAADSKRGVLTARIDETEVEVRIGPAEAGKTRLEVQARRVAGLSPDLETAKRVARAVAEQLD